MNITTRTPKALEVTATAVILTLGLALGGCSSGGGSSNSSSPTSVTTQTRTITTQWGDMSASSEVENPNWNQAERGADQGIQKIASQGHRVSLEQVRVLVSDDCNGGGTACNGRYYPEDKLIVARAGYEQVLGHELQHHACHELGLDEKYGSECCRLQDHPGGYDLSCNPI
ncbi:MAG: hypothetical protein R3234_02905 [Thermoanaerobaculia bacterium]|nr:hypothetical protein [Thermoanaerobaculia bacterium]